MVGFSLRRVCIRSLDSVSIVLTPLLVPGSTTGRRVRAVECLMIIPTSALLLSCLYRYISPNAYIAEKNVKDAKAAKNSQRNEVTPELVMNNCDSIEMKLFSWELKE